MTSLLEHLKLDKMPPSTKTPVGLPISPAVQAIIVDCVLVVNPQLTAIIGDNAEPVVARPEDSQAACPTHSKVIASLESRPFTACVAIVNIMSPSSHVRLTPVQILAPSTLAKVEGILHEKPSTISGPMTTLSHTTCARNSPSVSCIFTMVPE